MSELRDMSDMSDMSDLTTAWLAQAGLSGPREAAYFALAVLALNATPGVDMLLTMTRTLQGGLRAGFAAAAGITAGCAVHALAAALGLSALLALSATAFSVVKWLGAAYLLWLAWGLLRAALWAPAPAGDAADARAEADGTAPAVATVAHPSGAVDFRKGLFTNVLNPKVGLFFLAFLPQFIAASTPHKSLAFALLGAWFVVQGGLFLVGLVLLSGSLRRVRWSASAGRWAQGLAAALFAALAMRLALVLGPAA